MAYEPKPGDVLTLWLDENRGSGPHYKGKRVDGTRVVAWQSDDGKRINVKLDKPREYGPKPTSQPDGHADEPVAPITAEDVPF